MAGYAVSVHFSDIHIVDLDTRKTSWSRVHESMRVVYLKLDREPPDPRWVRLFQEERESRINPRRCGLWVENDYICFDCMLDEVEYIHLPDIQKSIDFANLRYRELLNAEAKRFQQAASDIAQEAVDLALLRQRVRDRVGATAADTSTTAAPADRTRPLTPAPSAPVIEQRAPDLPAPDEHDAMLAKAVVTPPEIESAADAATGDDLDAELLRRQTRLRADFRAARNPNDKENSDGAT